MLFNNEFCPKYEQYCSFYDFFGIILDLLYGKAIGPSAVMLCVIGYLGSYFDKNFSKENKFTIIFMVLYEKCLWKFNPFNKTPVLKKHYEGTDEPTFRV